ncbi:MAG: hypothetical protein ABIX01_18985 [Chitinophagaceae bacterium]
MASKPSCIISAASSPLALLFITIIFIFWPHFRYTSFETSMSLFNSASIGSSNASPYYVQPLPITENILVVHCLPAAFAMGSHRLYPEKN